MKRKVNVDLDELAIALDTDFSELHQYLDLETGRIIPIMRKSPGSWKRSTMTSNRSDSGSRCGSQGFGHHQTQHHRSRSRH